MTDDIDNTEELTLAAEYALGLLTPAETSAFEDVLAIDPNLRDQYAMWAESFVSLTDDVAPVAPPPQLEARIQEALFGKPAKKPSLFARLWPAAAGLAAAVVVLIGLNQTGFLQDEVGPVYVAQIAAEDQSLVVQASFDANANTLELIRTAGGPRAGRALEMWLIAGDNPPVSLGVWPSDDTTATLTVQADIAAGMQGGVLAISDEPLGGSTTGAPTGDVLAVGPVTLSI